MFFLNNDTNGHKKRSLYAIYRPSSRRREAFFESTEGLLRGQGMALSRVARACYGG